MERITIDVTRNRGSRSANLRVHVGPIAGSPGVSYVFATVSLKADQMLSAEVASHIAHSAEQALIFLQRGDIMAPIDNVPLPFDV